MARGWLRNRAIYSCTAKRCISWAGACCGSGGGPFGGSVAISKSALTLHLGSRAGGQEVRNTIHRLASEIEVALVVTVALARTNRRPRVTVVGRVFELDTPTY